MGEHILKTRVVTRSFIVDIIAKIKNTLGMRIKEYEQLIEKAHKDLLEELNDEGIELKWFRFEISQLTNGAMTIMLYGESK